jgi:adenylosuccinate synthase
VLVHEAAVPLTPDMVLSESTGPLSKIASTAQGSSAAQIRKMNREIYESVIARDAYNPPESLPIWVVAGNTWMHQMLDSEHILAECAQGYSLGINSEFYPFCTSRDCGPARFLSDMGIPFGHPVDVIGSIRTFPIRVGNVPGGNSGACYRDQKELSWEELGVEPEITTVTGRVRRVFSFSDIQLDEALMATGAKSLFVNFVNYLGGTDRTDFLSRVAETAAKHDARIRYIGTGPLLSHIREV